MKGISNTDELVQGETRFLWGITGQISWISSQTRPDVSFDSLELSVERNKASLGTLKRANKVVRKIKMRKSEIFFPETGELEKLEVHSDAGFRNLPDGMSSTQSQVILLRGHKQCCVLDSMEFSQNQKKSLKHFTSRSTLIKRSFGQCNLHWFMAVRIYFWRL